MEESRNWLDMPHELMTNILQRLRTAEKLNSARKVCTTWRRICKNPEMWKVIVMDKSLDDCEGDCDLERMTKHAVDLSCGELVDISIKGFGTDELLYHIVLRSCKLKRLLVKNCYDITGRGLTQAVKSVPLLEDLIISYISINSEHIKAIGQSCLELKTFVVFQELISSFLSCDANPLAIANNMPNLRCSLLADKEMSNYGLRAILNGCPHLEELYICMCYDLDFDGDLRKVCVERLKVFKYRLEVPDYYYDDGGVLSSRDVDDYPDYDD